MFERLQTESETATREGRGRKREVAADCSFGDLVGKSGSRSGRPPVAGHGMVGTAAACAKFIR
jgi:hypothetical protein